MQPRRPVASLKKGHLHAFCLGIDIVAYQLKAADIQRAMIEDLSKVVHEAGSLRGIDPSDRIFLPTANGIIICLRGGSHGVKILELAWEIQAKLRRRSPKHEPLVVRMGVHSGTGVFYQDINELGSITGAVVNTTQCVAAIGQEGHIIGSKSAFDDIGKLEHEWAVRFHSLGKIQANGKDKLQVYNIYDTELNSFGNVRLPRIEGQKMGTKNLIEQPMTSFCYGSTIGLQHLMTGSSLGSLIINYRHSESSGQEILFGSTTRRDHTRWIVRGPHGTPDDFKRGKTVYNSNIVRLQNAQTRHFLHSHLRHPSPATSQQEATGFVGKRDANDNWRIETRGPQSEMCLVHFETGMCLHSHLYQFKLGSRKFQEVTCNGSRDANDLWHVVVF